MDLIIHRGAHDIGGTCVEIATDEARIVIDCGTPLTDPRDETKGLKNFSLRGKTVPALIEDGILPSVSGLYWGVREETPVDAVLLSHPHQDHYGLFKYIREDIRIFLGEDTDRMLQVSEIFLGDRTGRHEDKVLLRDRVPLGIGDVKITPLDVDSSAYGTMAFLIEAEGKKIFYAGDFRGYGRQKAMLERGEDALVVEANVLLIEGSLTGREEDSPTEDALETAITHEARIREGMKFFICSGQDVDRLETFYRASKRSGAIFVLDLYIANVLHELGGRDLPLPTNGLKDVKVLFTNHFMKKLAEHHLKNWSERWRSHEITPEALRRTSRKAFVMFRDTSAHEFETSGIPKDSVLFYSLWNPYAQEPFFEKTQAFLDRHGIQLKEMHVSGQAILPDLERFAHSMNPDFIVPLHTERFDAYREHFGNKVRCLKDNEIFTI